MSLLPGQILPYTEPWGTVNADGSVTISKNWYLLLYNVVLNSLPSPTPTPQIKPVQLVNVGDSPFTYTAAVDGQLLLQGGLVTSITLIRSPTSLLVGLSAGQLLRLSRGDQVQITYGSVAPTANFFPE